MKIKLKTVHLKIVFSEIQFVSNYKYEILTSNILKVSIEASETSYWKKYTDNDGLNFGINEFGKSAPYKDIYNHFKLNEENIINKIKERF